ncbi:MAG: hypothetical protein ACOYNR_11420 [Blastocatellia bacterium]|jgi:hypothetical protein
MAIPDSFEIGLDRAETLLQHLPLRDRSGVLKLFADLTLDKSQALNPVAMLGILVRWLDWYLHLGRPQHGLSTGLFDLLFDGFAFPTSRHFGLLSHF